jgi:glycerophosphoryl diester phosphodiesterase
VSFARGLADGAGFIESDIHVSRDGVPVLIHDPEVDRTTDGKGAVTSFELDALQRLDAAHRFQAASGFEAGAWKPTGEHVFVPTLEQAFEAFPGVRFNFEIKGDSRELVRSVVALVRSHEREDITLLTSAEDDIQAMLREALAESGLRPALGASHADVLDVVQTGVSGDVPSTDSMVLQIPRDFAGQPLVTRELLDHCHAHDIAVHVWTINDAAEMAELLDLGVDGIVTDLPGVMADLLKQRPA